VRLGSWTYGYGKLPIEESLAHIAAVGYGGAELATGDDYSTPIDTLDDRRVDEILALFDRHRLVPTAVSGLFGLVATSAAEQQDRMRRFRRAVDVAARLGAPFVAIGSGAAPAGWHREQVWAELRRNAYLVAEYAGEKGVTVALEPHWGAAAERPGDALELLAAVGLPSLKVNVDVCHPFALGYDLASIARILGPQAVYAHVCDVRGRHPGDLQLCNPGEGEIDWSRWLRLLHDAGYQGWITVQISVMRRRSADYDPRASNEAIYRVLTDAMRSAGVPRLDKGAPRA
jgi:sugar phosphate isomerase/epimerase